MAKVGRTYYSLHRLDPNDRVPCYHCHGHGIEPDLGLHETQGRYCGVCGGDGKLIWEAVPYHKYSYYKHELVDIKDYG